MGEYPPGVRASIASICRGFCSRSLPRARCLNSRAPYRGDFVGTTSAWQSSRLVVPGKGAQQTRGLDDGLGRPVGHSLGGWWLKPLHRQIRATALQLRDLPPSVPTQEPCKRIAKKHCHGSLPGLKRFLHQRPCNEICCRNMKGPSGSPRGAHPVRGAARNALGLFRRVSATIRPLFKL